MFSQRQPGNGLLRSLHKSLPTAKAHQQGEALNPPYSTRAPSPGTRLSISSAPGREGGHEGPHTRTLTVTSYLTLLPTSRSDRMALSPRTTPEKKSCWGVATLENRGQNGD